VGNLSKPGKKATVELQAGARPSRIRRDPVGPLSDQKPTRLRIYWDSREWEIQLAIIGIIFFGLGINAVIFVISYLMGS
jgi:hypothetical protein